MNYIKYFRYLAATIVLVAIALHSFDMFPYGVYVHLAGALVWSVVAYKEKDYAVLLNFFPQIFILGSGILVYLI